MGWGELAELDDREDFAFWVASEVDRIVDDAVSCEGEAEGLGSMMGAVVLKLRARKGRRKVGGSRTAGVLSCGTQRRSDLLMIEFCVAETIGRYGPNWYWNRTRLFVVEVRCEEKLKFSGVLR